MEGGSEEEKDLDLSGVKEEYEGQINEQDAYRSGGARPKRRRRHKKREAEGSDDDFDDDYDVDEQRMTAREGDFDENDRIIMRELKRERRK